MAKKRRATKRRATKRAAPRRKKPAARRRRVGIAKKHTRRGLVRQHTRRVSGIGTHKRRKRRRIGSTGSSQIMKSIIPALVGFGVAKLLSRKAG